MLLFIFVIYSRLLPNLASNDLITSPPINLKSKIIETVTFAKQNNALVTLQISHPKLLFDNKIPVSR